MKYFFIVCSLFLYVGASFQAHRQTGYVTTSKSQDFFTLSEDNKSTTLFIGSTLLWSNSGLPRFKTGYR